MTKRLFRLLKSAIGFSGNRSEAFSVSWRVSAELASPPTSCGQQMKFTIRRYNGAVGLSWFSADDAPALVRTRREALLRAGGQPQPPRTLGNLLLVARSYLLERAAVCYRPVTCRVPASRFFSIWHKAQGSNPTLEPRSGISCHSSYLL